MESSSVCVDDTNNDDDNDADLFRLLINERTSTVSDENEKLLLRNDDVKKEYHTLENINPIPGGDENFDSDIHNSIEFEDINALGDYRKYLPDFDNELQLSDISNVMTRFTTDGKKNKRIMAVSDRIESNISECRTLCVEAKSIVSEKMNLQRDLNDVNEQIAFYTLEDTKYRRIQKRRGTECAKTGSYRRTYFCRFGIPYFKTKDRFPADQNDDLKEIIKNNEIMVIRMPTTRRILPQDTQLLDTSILNQLKIKRIQQLQLRMKHLKQPEEGNEEFEQQVCNLRGALENTKLVNDIRETKDWNIPVDFCALSKLNPRFSVEDYERMWQLLGNPCLSREDFSKEEVDQLKCLVHKYEGQDWDQIARELETNRSGFVCFNKWVMSAKKGTHKPWTKKEDDLLRKLCGKLDQIKDSANLYHWWRHIRRQFPHRTYTQIHGHWNYKLAPSLKKGRFTEDETQKLEYLIREGKSFGEIASIFQTRSSVQLRSHYNQIVERASHSSGPWTDEEEIALFQLIEKYGSNNWVQISKELGTRNRSQCRLKYLQGAWNPEETRKFQDLIDKFGTDFEKISQEIRTKSAGQCRLKYLRQKDSEPERPYNVGRWSRKESRLFRILVDKYKNDFSLISQELKTRNAEQCQEKYERSTFRKAAYPVKRIEVKILDGAEEEGKILKIYQNDTKLTAISRTSRWSSSEKIKFKALLKEYGCQFNKISDGIKTKSIQQCRNMYKKMNGEEIQGSSNPTDEEKINDSVLVAKGRKPFVAVAKRESSENVEIETPNQDLPLPNARTSGRQCKSICRKRKRNSHEEITDPLKEDTAEG